MAFDSGTVCRPAKRLSDAGGGGDCERLHFVSFPERGAGLRFLAGMAGQIPTSRVTLTLSYRGLVALGATWIASFPPELRGELCSCAVPAGLPGLPVHAILIVAADTSELLDDRSAEIRAVIADAGATELADPPEVQHNGDRLVPWSRNGSFVVYQGPPQESDQVINLVDDGSDDDCSRWHGILRRGITYGLADLVCPHAGPARRAPECGLLLLSDRTISQALELAATESAVYPSRGAAGSVAKRRGDGFFSAYPESSGWVAAG